MFEKDLFRFISTVVVSFYFMIIEQQSTHTHTQIKAESLMAFVMISSIELNQSKAFDLRAIIVAIRQQSTPLCAALSYLHLSALY